MHGIIFSELQKYVETRLGVEAWRKLGNDAGVGSKVYLSSETYPDSELVALVGAASKATGLDATSILESFGAFIVPDLVAVYGAYIQPGWKTLELIENTENTIHRVVRMRSPGAAPPELSVSRSGPKEVVVTYTSPRKLCAVARGIIRGVAEHYKQPVLVVEPECMLRGNAACRIRVTTAS